MKTIGLYLTKSGIEAMRIKERIIGGRKLYSWSGKLGAGSGGTLSDYQRMVTAELSRRKGIQTVIDIGMAT